MPLLILGGWGLFYIYAFASMIDPAIVGSDYWREVLSRMFFRSEGIVSWWCVAAIASAFVSVVLLARNVQIPTWWMFVLIPVAVGGPLVIVLLA